MNGFTGWDWAIFALFLLASLGIGIWAAIASRLNKQGDTNGVASEFLMGGRNLNPVAVALSTMIGAISSVTVLGNPAEMYSYGTQLWMNIIGLTIGTVYVHFVIHAVLYPLKITSVYTYVEKRFKSKRLRNFTVFTTSIYTFFYMGLCVYSPSLAMETVTGFPSWASCIVLGVICTIYSAWGGVRSIVYTDILQTFVMFAGVLIIMIHASVEAGGLGSVWSSAKEHGRLEWFNLDPNPLQRHSFWLVTAQGYFFSLSIFGMGQAQVQRTFSVSTWKKALGAHYLTYLCLVALFCCVNFLGVAIYAVYADCDPMATQEITKPDQIVPYYVSDRMSYLYGIPGLFVASLYAGGLSSYSSQINAVSAVIWESFLKNSELVAKMEESRKPMVNKGVSAITGILGTVAGIIASQLGGIFQVSQTLLGTIHAPLLGLFTLGICCPYANKIGGAIGFITSLLFNFWVTLGAMFYGKPTPYLHFDDDGCEHPTTDVFNSTIMGTTYVSMPTIDDLGPNDDYTFPLYLVSYTLYSFFGVCIAFFVGSIVSLLTSPWPADVSGKDYVHPAFYDLLKKWEEKHPPKNHFSSRKQSVELSLDELNTKDVNESMTQNVTSTNADFSVKK